MLGMKLVDAKSVSGCARGGAKRKWNLPNSLKKQPSSLVVWTFNRRDLDASFSDKEACVSQPVETDAD